MFVGFNATGCVGVAVKLAVLLAILAIIVIIF
jgi:hypothetical protein